MDIFKIILTIAMALAISLALTARLFEEPRPPLTKQLAGSETLKSREQVETLPRRTASRFLAQKDQNPRKPPDVGANRCNGKEEVCLRQGGGGSTTACCNDKCVDLASDGDNCGACDNQCNFSQNCCNGQCVYLAYDSRHCGECNHRCVNTTCIYGLCNYA